MEKIPQFLTAKEAGGLAERTIHWYGRQLEHARRWIEAAGLDPAEPDTIRAYLAARRRDVAPASVAASYRALRVFWNWAERETGEPSPMARVERPRVPKKTPRRASFADYERLAESIPRDDWIDLRDRLMVQVLFLSGARVAELCALDAADLDIGQKLIRIQGKGGKDRLLPIWPAVMPAALEYLINRPPSPLPALFYAGDGAGGVRGRITPSGVRQRLRKLCTRANVDYINPHAFRHGLAIWLLNSGDADMSMIQRILGHSQIATTQAYYADWLTDGLQRAYNRAVDRAMHRD